MLKALEASWLVDASTPALEAARMTLLDARDELHALTGRASDRVAPEMWGPLAERLGLADAEAAQRHVRSLGRRISHLSRLAWRRTDAVMARPSSERERRTPALTTVAPGIALSRGEVVLDRGTGPDDDPHPAAARRCRGGQPRHRPRADHRGPSRARGRRPPSAVAGCGTRRPRATARQRAAA